MIEQAFSLSFLSFTFTLHSETGAWFFFLFFVLFFQSSEVAD